MSFLSKLVLLGAGAMLVRSNKELVTAAIDEVKIKISDKLIQREAVMAANIMLTTETINGTYDKGPASQAEEDYKEFIRVYLSIR